MMDANSLFQKGSTSFQAGNRWDLLKQQIMNYGLDMSQLPPQVQQILPKLQNPNTRTLQLLVRLLGRIATLKEIKDAPEDLICFVFSKAPTADVASRLQALCDQQAQISGPTVVQKLMKAKKSCPEPRAFYYTQPLVGFKGLQERISEQSQFFQNYAATMKDLQNRQSKAHQEFQEKAIERLKLVRKRQSELRHRIIRLVCSLDTLAVRAQGFEGDHQDIQQVDEDYERLQKSLSSAPDSLRRSLPGIKQRLERLETNVKAKEGKRDGDGGKASYKHQSMLQELITIAKSHHQELDKVRRRLDSLAADSCDLLQG